MEMNYISQLGQDRFVDEYFNKKECGFFVDIGASDGVEISNTFFLEKKRNWSGICVEPIKEKFDLLQKNRNSINLNICISNFEGETEFTQIDGYANMLSGISDKYHKTHIERIQGEVNHYGGKINKININVKPLQKIFDEYNITKVDFCSIDTEGSELDIIKSIDFEKTEIEVFIIENNYKENEIEKFLNEKGYSLFKKLEWDDVFVKNKKPKKMKKMKNIVVTATNSLYFDSLLTLISSIHKHGFDCVDEIVVYNLGLNESELVTLRQIQKVEILNFSQEELDSHKNFITPKWHVYKLTCLKNFLNQDANVLWLDSGVCAINSINDIYQKIESDDIFLVEDTHLIKIFTHSKCKKFMMATEEELNGKILSSGIFGFNTVGKYKNLIREAYTYSLIPGCCDGDEENHRHDQSILSILSKRHNCPTNDIDRYGYWTDGTRNLQTALEIGAVIFVHRRGHYDTKDIKWIGEEKKNPTPLPKESNLNSSIEIQKIKIKLFDENLVGQDGLSRYISPNSNWIRNNDETNYDVCIFTDRFATIKEQDLDKINYAWLIEPPIINGENYSNIISKSENLKKVFSHNISLRDKINNFHFIPHGGTWLRNEDIGLHNKNKNVSFIYSDKQWILGHKLRHRFANIIIEKNIDVDLYGSGSPNKIDYKITGLKDYRFSIVIENSVSDDYFTEKLIDCFLTGTIPIYFGTKNVTNYFDENGIIFLPKITEYDFDMDGATELIKSLDEELYQSKIISVMNNFNKAQTYAHPEKIINEVIEKDFEK